MTDPLLTHKELNKNSFVLRRNLKLAHKYLNYPKDKGILKET